MESYISTDKTNGTGNDTVEVTMEPTDFDRTTTLVTRTAGGVTKSIDISQAGHMKIFVITGVNSTIDGYEYTGESHIYPILPSGERGTEVTYNDFFTLLSTSVDIGKEFLIYLEISRNGGAQPVEICCTQIAYSNGKPSVLMFSDLASSLIGYQFTASKFRVTITPLKYEFTVQGQDYDFTTSPVFLRSGEEITKSAFISQVSSGTANLSNIVFYDIGMDTYILPLEISFASNAVSFTVNIGGPIGIRNITYTSDSSQQAPLPISPLYIVFESPGNGSYGVDSITVYSGSLNSHAIGFSTKESSDTNTTVQTNVTDFEYLTNIVMNKLIDGCYTTYIGGGFELYKLIHISRGDPDLTFYFSDSGASTFTVNVQMS